jgi:tetratricopeptide (TPR) repeat protein
MGLVKYEQGDVEGALKKWQAATSIDKEQAEPQLAIAVALYSQGKQQQGLKLGESALKLDSRYRDLKFLKENLWGEKLLQDTQALLNNPSMKSFLSSLPVEPEDKKKDEKTSE